MVELDLQLARAVEGAALDQVVAVVGLAARGLLVELEGGSEAELVAAAGPARRCPRRSRRGTAAGGRAAPVYGREPHGVPTVVALDHLDLGARRRHATSVCTFRRRRRSRRSAGMLTARSRPDSKSSIETGRRRPSGWATVGGPSCRRRRRPQAGHARGAAASPSAGASLTPPPPDSRRRAGGQPIGAGLAFRQPHRHPDTVTPATRMG